MQVPNVANLLDQPIYDTMQAAAAAGQTLRFFSVPLGQPLAAGILKDYQHTNMIQAGRLEEGNSLVIRGITFYVKHEDDTGTPVTWADYTLIYNTSHVNLQIGQVSMLRLPLCQIPAAAGETDYFSNIAPAATEYNASKGLGSINNKYNLAYPLTLKGNEGIAVDLFIGGTVGAVTDIQCVLWGDMTRPAR